MECPGFYQVSTSLEQPSVEASVMTGNEDNKCLAIVIVLEEPIFRRVFSSEERYVKKSVS
jgi:hypothetical protein